MAIAEITEFSSMPFETGSFKSAPLALEPANTHQKITFTATPGQSAAFGAQTYFIRILVDGDARILFGTNPTATTSNEKILANTPEWRAVRPGQKVSVVAA